MDEWDKIRFLIDAGISFCINIGTYTDLLKQSTAGFPDGLDLVTDTEILMTGVYGYFKNGTVKVCVSKEVGPGMIKVFNDGLPADAECKGWSPQFPIEYINEMDRILQLKAFW